MRKRAPLLDFNIADEAEHGNAAKVTIFGKVWGPLARASLFLTLFLQGGLDEIGMQHLIAIGG